jgi:hypothetical protein
MINLLDYRSCKYSTIGNDGIIEHIFNTLGIDNGFFVEFGAWDGIKNSNCKGLHDKGWQGIFIESDEEKYDELKSNYSSAVPHVTCLRKQVGSSGDQLFDNIVRPVLGDGNIDICSIDIDGRDLEIFETFEEYLPTVVVIEGGQMLHPLHKRVSDSIAKKNIQQSLKVFVESFEKKGYRILCTYQDSFFIKEEFYHLFDVPSDLITLYFDGLRKVYRRMPFIQKYGKKAGVKNQIVDYILKETMYNRYGWKNRKKWAAERSENILKLINTVEKRERCK